MHLTFRRFLLILQGLAEASHTVHYTVWCLFSIITKVEKNYLKILLAKNLSNILPPLEGGMISTVYKCVQGVFQDFDIDYLFLG